MSTRHRSRLWTTEHATEQRRFFLATHSAVSSKLEHTFCLLLADERRGEIHGVGVQKVRGGVFALNPGARVRVGGWSGSEQSTKRRERGGGRRGRVYFMKAGAVVLWRSVSAGSWSLQG
ncbi:hypothetical protein SVAN01_06327 [Stagonosporopsis vannaccii]|nr:hypothetical protein SVAN01_06327 [Stagonosporopsis vannaccii]